MFFNTEVNIIISNTRFFFLKSKLLIYIPECDMCVLTSKLYNLRYM